MIQWLSIIGLVVIPFAHLEHYSDQCFLKEYVGLLIALSIVFYALYVNGLQCIKNKWMLFALGAMVVSTSFVPPSGLVLGNLDHKFVYSTINIENLWNYKPILIGLTYLLMVCALAYTDLDGILILKTISWMGFLMALVLIAQKFGFQQFWRVQDGGEIGLWNRAGLMGFMAQYSLVASFLSICQISSLFLRKFCFATVMTVAVLITGSHFGYLCAFIGWILWLLRENRKLLKYIFPIIGVCVFLSLCLFHKSDDGRFGVWLQIYHDVTHPLFDNRLAESQGFTGFGAGAFSVFFPILHQSPWGFAHNEFLEFLFNNGILGIGLLLTAITVFFKDCMKSIENPIVQCCLFSFIITCILSNGTFLWHLGWGQFYTAVIVGLAYSAIRKGQYGLVSGSAV